MSSDAGRSGQIDTQSERKRRGRKPADTPHSLSEAADTPVWCGAGWGCIKGIVLEDRWSVYSWCVSAVWCMCCLEDNASISMNKWNQRSRDRRWYPQSKLLYGHKHVHTLRISSSLTYACMHDESCGRHWSKRLCSTLSCPGGELGSKRDEGRRRGKGRWRGKG
jgi:hypothetical protein